MEMDFIQRLFVFLHGVYAIKPKNVVKWMLNGWEMGGREVERLITWVWELF